MNKIFFYSLPFECHDVDPSFEHRYHRIQAGNKTFYTDKNQFHNIDVLGKLQVGDNIFVGARQLADETYWLHWLISLEKGTLQPNTLKKNKLSGLLKILIALILLYLLISIFIVFENVVSSLICLMLIILVGWLLSSGLHSWLVSTINPMRQLLQAFDQVKAGNSAICHPISLSLMSSDSKSSVLEQLDKLSNDLDSVKMMDLENFDEDNIIQISGAVSNIRTREDSVGSGKYRKEFINYEFMCDNKLFHWYRFYNILTNGLNPIFFRRHPFFIAPDDPLILLVNKKKRIIEGLYNQKDGSTYLKVSSFFVTFGQIRVIYKIMLIIMLTMMVMMIGIQSPPDQLDWIQLANQFYNIGLIVLIVFCFNMFIVEIFAVILRRYSSAAARAAYLRQKLIMYKINAKKKIYIQEEA